MRKKTAPICLLALAGCTADIDSQFTEYSFGSFVEFGCDDAEFQRSQYEKFFVNLPEPKNSEIKLAMLEAEARCGKLRPIYEGLAKSYGELETGVWLPRSRYVFDFLARPEDKRTVGLFETESACESARSVVLSLGYEANECQKRTLFRRTVWA